MKALKTAIFAATMMSGATAMAAEVSGNVAIGSDYFFRGIDQSGGEALSGGLDVAFESGLYTSVPGLRLSTLAVVVWSLDYYAGYGGSFLKYVSLSTSVTCTTATPRGVQASEEFEEVYGSCLFL
jgi:uncharacterized protein (TIGR02001 family)